MEIKDKKILVTGGAGYIGSHICYALLAQEAVPIIVDNLSRGYEELKPYGVAFHKIDVRETDKLINVIKEHDVDGVIHMAAFAAVGESSEDPILYYQNNVDGTASVLKACEETGIENFVFSSTCAVYGSVGNEPADENLPIKPESPYGESKAMAETMIKSMSRLKDIRSVILRYFNVAGADPELRCGMLDPRAQRLFMMASAAATGERERLDIFGDDYDTPDGTCVRDYIHVSDLADIHIEALKYLMDGGKSTTMNCGYSKGYSVKEVAEGMQRISGIDFEIKYAPRRPGDPSSIIADTTKMQETLGWSPQYDDIDILLKTSYQWRLKQNKKKQ